MKGGGRREEEKKKKPAEKDYIAHNTTRFEHSGVGSVSSTFVRHLL